MISPLKKLYDNYSRYYTWAPLMCPKQLIKVPTHNPNKTENLKKDNKQVSDAV